MKNLISRTTGVYDVNELGGGEITLLWPRSGEIQFRVGIEFQAEVGQLGHFWWDHYDVVGVNNSLCPFGFLLRGECAPQFFCERRTKKGNREHVMQFLCASSAKKNLRSQVV